MPRLNAVAVFHNRHYIFNKLLDEGFRGDGGIDVVDGGVWRDVGILVGLLLSDVGVLLKLVPCVKVEFNDLGWAVGKG